jgi:hypothetical protein
LVESSCRWNEMPLQFAGKATVTFSVAGPMVTVVMSAKPGPAGGVVDRREPGADGEILAAVQPGTLAERQRGEVVRVVDNPEPLVGPA